MLAGLLTGIVHDRKLIREAQVNIAVRWFAGYGLHEQLPHHSSLRRIRQRWGEERFRRIFKRTVEACLKAKIATAEVVHIDASLIRANVSWDSLTEQHVVDVLSENQSEDESEDERKAAKAGSTKRSARLIPMRQWLRMPETGGWNPLTSSTRPSMTRSVSFWMSRSRLDKRTKER
ncbi:transposase [Bradyrhizobium sp. RT5a]